MLSKVAKSFSQFTNGADSIRAIWDGLRRVPGGTRLFSKVIATVAPYSGSIDARPIAIERGYAEFAIDEKRRLRNHLRSIHALALANLGELTATMALGYTIPTSMRFIVSGLGIDYLKKARGRIVSRCEFDVIDSEERHEYTIPVSLRDNSGDEVARLTLRALVAPRPQPS